MDVAASALPLSVQVGKHSLRRSPAAGHSDVDRGVVAMVSARINAGPNPYRALRRFQRAGILLRLRVRDAVTPQQLPAAGHFAEQVFHLRDDESAELRVR